jgi:hypothetical protein
MVKNHWTEHCKDEFKWIRDQITNHLPSLIRKSHNMLFWKMAWLMVTLVGVIFAIVKIWG